MQAEGIGTVKEKGPALPCPAQHSPAQLGAPSALGPGRHHSPTARAANSSDPRRTMFSLSSLPLFLPKEL